MQDAGAAGPAESPDAKTEAGEEKVRGEFCEARSFFAPEREPKMHTVHCTCKKNNKIKKTKLMPLLHASCAAGKGPEERSRR